MVRVVPITTPPCIANGTIYERLPGKSQQVRDPLVLADLYRRGDQARREAETRGSSRISGSGWMASRRRWVFQSDSIWQQTDLGAGSGGDTEQAAQLRFAVGVAATGNPPDISARLFQNQVVETVWSELDARPTGPPAGFSPRPDPVTPSQDALTWRHQTGRPAVVTVVRAAWDGSVAVGQQLSWDSIYPNNFMATAIASEWRYADELVQRPGGFGDMYVTIIVAGGRFPRRDTTEPVVMRRGPVLAGVNEEHVASLGRELKRALGNFVPEP